MRFGTRGRRRVSLPGASAAAAIAAIIALTVGACSPASTTASGPNVQATTAAKFLSTEQDASSALSTANLNPPDDFCTNLVEKFGGTTSSGKDGAQIVTVPDFTAPSTFQVDRSATALKNEQQTKRLWSNAVNSALPLTRVKKGWKFTLQAVEASACSEPDYASMLIRGFSSAHMGGKTVLQANPWMSQGSPSPMQTQKWANNCMDGGISVQVHCAQIMAKVAYMFTKFVPEGVHKLTTSWYFQLKTGLVVGGIPPIESVLGSYTGYFLVFRYTIKGSDGCFLDYGINVGWKTPNGGDQRLAGFMCDQPQATAPATSGSPTPVTTQPASSPPVSNRPTPHPTPSQTHPTPMPSQTTPSKAPPSTSPPTTAPPTTPPPTSSTPTPTPTKTDCECTSTPTPTPSHTQCGCTSTPTPSASVTQCGCTATPSVTPSTSVTPSETYTPTDTASPSDTPSAQCTCMNTVAQVNAEALSLGFSNIFDFGAYPPPGTKLALAA